MPVAPRRRPRGRRATRWPAVRPRHRRPAAVAASDRGAARRQLRRSTRRRRRMHRGDRARPAPRAPAAAPAPVSARPHPRRTRRHRRRARNAPRTAGRRGGGAGMPGMCSRACSGEGWSRPPSRGVDSGRSGWSADVGAGRGRSSHLIGDLAVDRRSSPISSASGLTRMPSRSIDDLDDDERADDGVQRSWRRRRRAWLTSCCGLPSSRPGVGGLDRGRGEDAGRDGAEHAAHAVDGEDVERVVDAGSVLAGASRCSTGRRRRGR